MTVRALAGLAALNLAYAVVGSRCSGRCAAFRTWGAVLRLAGLGYLLGLAAFGVLWTALLVAGVPVRRQSGSCVSLVGPRRGRASCAGLAAQVPRSSAACPFGARPDRCSSPAAGVALAGLFLEALFRAGAAAEPPGVRRVGVLGAEGRWRSTSSAASTSTSSRPRRTRRTRRCSPILDAAAFHAMGGADVVTLHVQFWFLVVGAVAAAAGLPPSARARLAPLAAACCSSSSSRASASGCWRRRPTSSSTSSSSSRHCSLALWLRDAARLAARRGGGAARRRGANTKREGILFAACVLAAAFVVSGPRRWPRLAAASLVVGARGASLAALDRPARHRRRARRRRRSAPAGSRGALRLSFDVLYSNARWSVLPRGRHDRARRSARSGAIRRLAAYVGLARRRCSSPAASGRRSASRSSRSPPTSREPDRALHGVDGLPGGRRRSPAPGLGLASAVRSP